MKNKAVVRMIIGLFAIAGLFLLYRWWENLTADPDLGSLDSTGMVAAIEYLPDGGSRVVVFDEDGEKREVPNYSEGANDEDPVWRPDGQRVFFVSDRENRSHNIYRWNLATDAVESRYESDRSAGSPSFGPFGWPDQTDSALITLGGNVFSFDQHRKATRQVLPPLEFAGAQGESEQAMDAIKVAYERVGNSFTKAVWGMDRKVIYAIMQRESDQVFVICYLEQIGEVAPMPVPVLAGQSLQFDVARDGKIVVSVQGFEFVDPAQIPTEMIRNGRAFKPFRNAVYVMALAEDGQITPPQLLYTDQADLGIQPGDMNPEHRAEHNVPDGVEGVLVEQVAPGGAADQMGIKPGDVITAVNGKPTPDPNTMFNVVVEVLLGEKATFTINTAGTARTVEYTFGFEDSVALRDPAWSPSGTELALTMGRVSDRFNFTPMQLLIIPLEGGLRAGRRLVEGQIYDPHWSPDGRKIVYSKVGPSGDSQIYVINSDGSGEKNLSGPGDYGKPKFSPMEKSGG
jgi:hypothetical protein